MSDREKDIPEFYCSSCGRKLEVNKRADGFDQTNGKPRFIYVHSCPAPLVGCFHDKWQTRIDGNGVIHSQCLTGWF